MTLECGDENRQRVGCRRRSVSQVRSQIARDLVESHEVPLAEVARYVGVSTSAISKVLTKQ